MAALALVFHAANGLFAALMGKFPTSLDELQHLSFIRAMEQTPQLLPRYEDLRVLDAGGARFTDAVNYLNHPSPYYLLMGLADRAVGGSILGLRLIDIGVSVCAVALMLFAGFRVLKGWKERAVFAAVLVLFPKIGVVAGMINNDNAALLATGVAFLGLVEWQRRPTNRTALGLAAAVTLCGWTKLTVLLMIGFSVLIGEGLRWWMEKKRPGLTAYAVLGAGFLIAAIPTLANIAAYGRVVHHTLAFYVEPAQRVSLSPVHYAWVFLCAMVEKWAALEPSGLARELGLYLVLGLSAAVVAVTLRRPRGPGQDLRQDADWRTASAMILAIAPVLLLHLYFGWRTFVEDGFIEMAQTRYYYGLWPGLALGLALLWRNSPQSSPRTPVAIVVTGLLFTASLFMAGLVHLMAGQTSMG